MTSFEFDYSKAAPGVNFSLSHAALNPGGAYSSKYNIVSFYRSESFVVFDFDFDFDFTWLGGVSMHKGSSLQSTSVTQAFN